MSAAPRQPKSLSTLTTPPAPTAPGEQSYPAALMSHPEAGLAIQRFQPAFAFDSGPPNNCALFKPHAADTPKDLHAALPSQEADAFSTEQAHMSAAPRQPKSLSTLTTPPAPTAPGEQSYPAALMSHPEAGGAFK